MKRFLVTLLLILLTTSEGRSNEPLAVGSPLALAVQKKVQEELKLTEQQLEQLRSLHEQATKGNTQDVREKLGKVLTPDQIQRLKQISYQLREGAALADPEVVEALKLSLTQKRKIADIWKNEEENLRQMLRVARFRSEAARRKFILEQRKGAGKKMLEYLTEAQATELKKLFGKSYTVKDLEP